MTEAGQFEARYLNRMTSILQSAVEQACAEDDVPTAESLLAVLETVLSRAAEREEHREKSVTVLQSVFGRVWKAKQGLQANADGDPHAALMTPAIQAYDALHIVQNEARQIF